MAEARGNPAEVLALAGELDVEERVLLERVKRESAADVGLKSDSMSR